MEPSASQGMEEDPRPKISSAEEAQQVLRNIPDIGDPEML